MTPHHLIWLVCHWRVMLPNPEARTSFAVLSTYKPEHGWCVCSLLLSLKAKSHHGQIQRFLVMFRVSTEQWFLEDQRFLILDDSRCFREYQKHTTQQQHTQKTETTYKNTHTQTHSSETMWKSPSWLFPAIPLMRPFLCHGVVGYTGEPRQWQSSVTRIWINPTRITIVCHQNNWEVATHHSQDPYVMQVYASRVSIVCHVIAWTYSLFRWIQFVFMQPRLDPSLTKSKWVETCIYQQLPRGAK